MVFNVQVFKRTFTSIHTFVCALIISFIVHRISIHMLVSVLSVECGSDIVYTSVGDSIGETIINLISVLMKIQD